MINEIVWEEAPFSETTPHLINPWERMEHDSMLLHDIHDALVNDVLSSSLLNNDEAYRKFGIRLWLL